jgi:hypothetical protein
MFHSFNLENNLFCICERNVLKINLNIFLSYFISNVIIKSYRVWNVLPMIGGAWKLLELIEAVDPFVEDPLGTLQNGTPSVRRSVVSVS